MNTNGDINLILKYQGKDILVNTATGQFSDLRELIIKKLQLDFFGECGGLGRCVTCMVEVNSGTGEFACQVPIDASLNTGTIKVIGDRLKRI